MESDITGDTSGTFESLLISLVQVNKLNHFRCIKHYFYFFKGERDEDTAVDYRKVKEDARLLYDAGMNLFKTFFPCFQACPFQLKGKENLERMKALSTVSLQLEAGRI